MSMEEKPPVDLSRRQVLKAAAAAGGAASVSISAPAIASTKPRTPYTTPFAVPLPVYTPKQPASVLQPSPLAAADLDECGRDDHQAFLYFPPKQLYELRVREAMHSFHPELPTQPVWGYDGIVPGPTIVARYGSPVIVRIYNELPAATNGFGSPEISTHLHNAHAPAESDGFTGSYYSQTRYGPSIKRAGKFMDHHYPNCYPGLDKYIATAGDPREALGTLWYHDHRIDFTAPNVYRGLAGFYLLFDAIDSGNENDPNPRALRLPSGVGRYDIPLVFRDLQFDASGYLWFDQFETDGVLGDRFTVNGKIQPYFSVERRKYRFRLLDGGPARFYEFFLVHEGKDQSFTYIANDGNLLPAPLTMQSVRMAPAERADIVIDFSKYPRGSKLYLVNRLKQDDGRGPSGLTSPGVQILRFDVDRDPAYPDHSRVPAKLRDLPPITMNEVVKHRTWEFDRENGFWTVNHKVFDVDKPAAVVKRGTAEIWTLFTKGGWHHPVHIHFEEGRILTRNGKPPAPHEAGRKDVFVLAPYDVVRVFMRFRDFTGKYMMHCHNTTHEDHAMMVRFDVVP